MQKKEFGQNYIIVNVTMIDTDGWSPWTLPGFHTSYLQLLLLCGFFCLPVCLQELENMWAEISGGTDVATDGYCVSLPPKSLEFPS